MLAQQRPDLGFAPAEGDEGVQCITAAALGEDAVHEVLVLDRQRFRERGVVAARHGARL